MWLTALQLQTGDLVFQDLDCGPLCDAIEQVTPGLRGAEVTHVGMVVVGADGLTVIEAIGPAVQEIPLEQFLARTSDSDGRPKVFVERLRDPARIPAAVAWMQERLGTPYDDRFDADDRAFYCSELMQDALNAVGEPAFPPIAMTFRKPGSKRAFPAWARYFRQMAHPIPEGSPGSNPGHLSLSAELELVGRFGTPDGWVDP